MTKSITPTIHTRREFCKQLSLASIALTIPGCMVSQLPQALILGGTNFLGPAIVTAYLQAGYEVTLFNRGVTNSHLFPQQKKLIGDRSQGGEGYKALATSDKIWDVVVDVWPQEPHYVEDALKVLQGKAKHYQFVSSIAVYESFRQAGLKESAPLLPAQSFEEGNYSVNKVLCEKLIAQYFPNSHTVVRPGAIVGERDPGPFNTDLIKRMAQRKELIAVNAEDPVQFIDADDVGNFLTLQAKSPQSGIYNLVGPEETLSYKALIQAIKRKVNPRLKIHWVEPEWALKEAGLSPFTEVPFWIPLAYDPEPGFYQVSAQNALQAGLSFKPLTQTISDAHKSWQTGDYIAEPESEELFGIAESREDNLIQAWLTRVSNPTQ